MSRAANTVLYRRFIDEIVNGGKLDRIDELLATDHVEHNAPPGLPPGREGFRQFLRMIATAFPDLHVTIEDLVADGDRVAARLTVRGTHRGPLLGTIPATGIAATWTGMDIVRVAGGRIAERWSERDLLGLMRQLGVVAS